MPNAATAQIIGHVVADAEARFDKQGKPVANFKVAVNQGYGEKKSVGWYKVVCFGKTAEWVGKNVKKGMAMFAAGELKMDEWTSNDGHKNVSPEIVANTIQSLEKRDRLAGGYKAADNNPDILF